MRYPRMADHILYAQSSHSDVELQRMFLCGRSWFFDRANGITVSGDCAKALWLSFLRMDPTVLDIENQLDLAFNALLSTVPTSRIAWQKVGCRPFYVNPAAHSQVIGILDGIQEIQRKIRYARDDVTLQKALDDANSILEGLAGENPL